MLRLKLPALCTWLLLGAWALLSCTAAPTRDPDPHILQLAAPAPADADHAIWLQLRVGPLPRGTTLTVASPEGQLLGTVSPYGVPPGPSSALYTIPLPKTAVVNGVVRIRIDVETPGQPSRAATSVEVQEARLILVPISVR